MITLPLTVLIVVCLSIGATIGLAVAAIVQINKGEDDA